MEDISEIIRLRGEGIIYIYMYYDYYYYYYYTAPPYYLLEARDIVKRSLFGSVVHHHTSLSGIVIVLRRVRHNLTLIVCISPCHRGQKPS